MKGKPDRAVWREGFKPPAGLSAAVAAEELTRIRDHSAGQLTAPIVLAEATKESSPLHCAFEWDDSSAANQYRLNQARELMRGVILVYYDDEKQEERQIRAFVSYEPGPDEPEVKGGRSEYIPVREALSREQVREQLIERAWDELLRWQARYEHLQEFAGIHTAIKRARVKAAESPAAERHQPGIQ